MVPTEAISQKKEMVPAEAKSQEKEMVPAETKSDASSEREKDSQLNCKFLTYTGSILGKIEFEQ